MMRSTLFWLSKRRSIFNFVRSNGLAKKFASRFVAGETIETGVAAALETKAKGITASLDLLGESVHQPKEAEAARDAYIAILQAMAKAGLEANASLKPTALGLDIDEALCERNIRTVLEVAKASGAFVRLDMEGSAYTQRTLDFFTKRVFPDFGEHTGLVIQAMLRRSSDDIDLLIRLGARVRLCKGAYLEPASVAFPDKKDVDANYIRLMERLLVDGKYPAIATHDEAIIAHAKAFVTEKGIARDRFEFQMLFGVRRDLQETLVKEGYRLRVYIPFGTQWYPYLMRRLAERPANIVFILGNIMKEITRKS